MLPKSKSNSGTLCSSAFPDPQTEKVNDTEHVFWDFSGREYSFLGFNEPTLHTHVVLLEIDKGQWHDFVVGNMFCEDTMGWSFDVFFPAVEKMKLKRWNVLWILSDLHQNYRVYDTWIRLHDISQKSLGILVQGFANYSAKSNLPTNYVLFFLLLLAEVECMSKSTRSQFDAFGDGCERV